MRVGGPQGHAPAHTSCLPSPLADDAALTAILDSFEWKVSTSTNRQLVTAVWAMGALQLGGLVTDRLWNAIEAAVLQQVGGWAGECGCGLSWFFGCWCWSHTARLGAAAAVRRYSGWGCPVA